MNLEVNIEHNLPDQGPKISFLETFSGVLSSPRQVFDDLYNEEAFTVLVYGILSVLLASLGKLELGPVGPLGIIGIEIVGLFSWFLTGIFIFFLSTVFKTPNNNFGRLLGFTGIANLPFLLLIPISLAVSIIPWEGMSIFYFVCEVIINVWSFVLFWIALAKTFQLEAWRVLLMAIFPFLLGLFLFTFLIANLLGTFF
jgi:hypothetical protein